MSIVTARSFTRPLAIKLGIAGLLLCTQFAYAAGTLAEAQARYEKERAGCLAGRSNQDQATCLKEAGAALDEAKHHELQSGPGPYAENARKRCEALPGDQREACLRRMNGEGYAEGSARDGGIIRELVVPNPK